MLIIGGTQSASLLNPPQMEPRELVYSFDLEASTWHPKASIPVIGNSSSEPAPWNLVYHSLFKVDTHNVGVLWYDHTLVHGSEVDSSDISIAAASQSPKNVLRTSIYNMVKNSWRSIRLVTPSPELTPLFRFGCTLIPVFDKHVASREQIETAKKVKPRDHGPVPLTKLLILGGTSLDDTFFDSTLANPKSTLHDHIHCTILNFTNSNVAPMA